MENFIQIQDNDYTVKISLENINYEDIPILLYELEENFNNWSNFYAHDPFWYYNASKYLTCQAVNHNDKVIIFG